MPPTHHRRAYFQSSSSSDSDSDEASNAPRRLRPQNKSQPPPAEQKKKKKKRYPPQESIDRIWTSFSQKRFSKAMAILPSQPVAPSTLSSRSNELFSESYERTAEECRRKVRKIIQECRRVNMRYRDPGWDIDWDLKMCRGNCLNCLGKKRFDLSNYNRGLLTANIPKAVKRVHEIFEKPTFLKSITGSDLKQGGLGDCWFISSASGLANVPGGIERVCVEYDTKIGIYGFVFFRDGEWIYSIIDDKLYLTSPNWDSPSFQRDLLQQIDQDRDAERIYRKTYQTGSKALFFAQNKDQNETWMPLLEKAYAKAHGDYDSLTGGWIGEAMEDLTGGATTELLVSDIFDTDSFWDDEISRVNEEFFFGCSTGLLDGGTGDRNGIREAHAYNITQARTLKDGTRLLQIRNPWGNLKRGIWSGPWSDGSREWTPEAQEELGHSFGNDSVFWIAYEDFLTKFQHIDRTRLFREPDWRCCQRWIGVDVPWRASYNEKFHFTLARASPVVIVLSQLDSRYFEGLVGQYFFRLRFRLHEKGRSDAEEYIVRSHGNYLMDRSVTVDLPSLDAGQYSVWISVEAVRDHKALSVEDVVKRELKIREENEKLAQVGQAYDLAHSKAAGHMAELAKLRKKADHQTASDERKTERRKAWVKRHLLKDIRKRQQKKNDEKKKRQEAEKEKEKEAEKEAEKEKEKKDGKPEDKEVQVDLVSEAKEAKAKEAKTSSASTTTASRASSVSSSGSSTPIHTPLNTPKSERTLEPAPSSQAKVPVPPIDDLEGEDHKAETLQTEEPSTETSVPEGKADGETADKTQKLESAPPSLESEDGIKGKEIKTEASQQESTEVQRNDAKAEEGVGGKEHDEKKKEEKEKGERREEKDQKDQKDQKDKKEQKGKKDQRGKEDESDSEDSGTEKGEANNEDDESSDSPIEDWEEWYSSDDLTTGSSRQNSAAVQQSGPLPEEEDSDDEKLPTPWNAICVVGIRVYSKDEDLELRVVMEGGSLLEDGMGEKGEPDIDNAQANAGGERMKEKEEEKKEKEGKKEDEKEMDEMKEKKEEENAEEKKDDTHDNDSMPKEHSKEP